MQTKNFLTLGSLFSGIEGFGLGFELTGKFKIQWQVEQDAFCNRVLGSHWPAVPRHADVCKVGKENLAAVDCITAGVPCQDVSIAGKRAGLAGKRTGLFYEFARILQEIRPRWFVFENVPGLFSSNRGRDFAEILRVLMVECGYGVSWRVLDSRYFGVAQRRRRVFLVGYLGKPCPPEILFEPEGGEGHFAPRGEAGTDFAGTIVQRIGKGGFTDPVNDNVIAVAGTLNSRHSSNGHGAAGPRVEDIPNLVAATLPACRRLQTDGNRDNLIAVPLTSGSCSPENHAPGRRREDDFNLCVIQDVRGRRDNRQNGIGISEGGPCYSLTKVDRHAVSYSLRNDPGGIGQGHNTTFVTNAIHHQGRGGPDDGDAQGGHLVVSDAGAQERAMHIGGDAGRNAEHDGDANAIGAPPDSDGVRDFTGLPKGMDSARYRSLGNAVTATVAHWIARRIVAYEFLSFAQNAQDKQTAGFQK